MENFMNITSASLLDTRLKDAYRVRLADRNAVFSAMSLFSSSVEFRMKVMEEGKALQREREQLEISLKLRVCFS